MCNTDLARFDSFACKFVRSYWRTVKENKFPMPPNEPVEETVEELIAAVSYTTEVQPSTSESLSSYKLLMKGECRDWWLFSFHDENSEWTLTGCMASSDKKNHPHDLLGPVYSQYIEPFLAHITKAANLPKSK